MKKILNKRFYIFIFPVLAIAITLGAIILNSLNEDLIEEIQVDLNEDLTSRKIYVLSDDEVLVPLSLSFTKKDTLSEDIISVLNLLREGSPVEDKGYHPLLSSSVSINSIELDNNILNVDFSEEFNDYDVSKENLIIEGLTWSLMQYDEIDGVTLSVSGQKIERMPVGGTPLPSILTKAIGINKYHDTSGDILDTVSVTIFYEKEINGEEVYVPVTRRVKPEESINKTIFNALKTTPSVLSGYKSLGVMSYLDKDQSVIFEEDEISIPLIVNSLIEENIMNEKIYEVFKLIYEDLNNIAVNFMFEVNDEAVSVNGYPDYNDTAVSAIIINEFKI